MTAAAYTTKERVKVSLGIVASDTSQDSEIDKIILEVSQWFDTEATDSFTQLSRVEFYDGFSLQNGIPLNHLPSEDATDRGNLAVEENGVVLVNGTDFAIDEFPSRVLQRTNGTAEDFAGARWRVGERNVKVTYLTAFKVLPLDVQLAANDESHDAFAKKNIAGYIGDGPAIGLESRTPETGTGLSYSIDDFSPGTVRMLSRYRQLFAVL